jgi:hypothetical protein
LPLLLPPKTFLADIYFDERKRQQKKVPPFHLSHQKLMIGLEYDNAGALNHN